MNIDQAFKNLSSLLDSPDLRISYIEHCGLRQSLQLLNQKALDGEELKEQMKDKSEKKAEKDDSPNE